MQESSSSLKKKVTTKSTKDDYETTGDVAGGDNERKTLYDPHSKQMPPPVAIDERMLPDLHWGWGSNVLCTHSQREILQNRLLSCLLNRLAFNYYHTNTNSNHHHSHPSSLSAGPTKNYDDKKQDKVFCIILDRSSGGDGDNDDHDDDVKQIITKPSELIQALMDMGHSVEACITTHVTSFGVALCVKEMDDSWTQLPMACKGISNVHSSWESSSYSSSSSSSSDMLSSSYESLSSWPQALSSETRGFLEGGAS
jgi:hypothetical protein